MFKKDEIRAAVDIQQRSYRLFKWLGSAMGKGFISYPSAHEYTNDREAAQGWISEHLHNIPPDSRPSELAEEIMVKFANFFSSFITTSFEIVERPGKHLVSGCGCYCSFCAYLAEAPHLVPKKLKKADKRKAEKLKEDFLKQLALDCKVAAPEIVIQNILNNQELSEKAAIATYGQDLLRRCSGSGSGAATLALWRQFAWDKKGARKKGYILKADEILLAEKELAVFMQHPQE